MCVCERGGGGVDRGGTPSSGRGDEGLMKLFTLILFTIRALPGPLTFESIEI